MKKKYKTIIIITFLGLTFGFFTPFLLINRGDNMGNNQCFKFTDLSITSAKLPQNTHLIWEISSSLIYMVDSTNQLVLLKSVDKGANWTTVTTRSHKIQAGWHDRTNGYIWFVDCDNDGTADDFDVWKITIDGNDTITSIGSGAGGTADANTVYAYDIFKIGTEFFVINREQRAGVHKIVVWDVDSAPFGEEDNVNPVSDAYGDIYYGIVIGNKYYTYAEWTTGVFNVEYNHTTTTLSGNAWYDGFETPPESQRALAYDGTNLIYFVMKKTADSKKYLFTYSISGVSFTELGEYNIALMLDRNCANTVPNELEKAFDIAKDANNLSRIFEIKPRKGGLIQLQSIVLAQNIIAITDNYLMFANGAVYEYTDILATNTIAEGKVNKGIFPIMEKGWFNCHPDDSGLFYNNDSIKAYDDTDEMILFAKITDKSQDENGIYQFGLDAYTNELWRRSYVKTHTTTTTREKQQDNVDNACSFCHRDSSHVATTTDYSYEQDRPPMAIYDMARIMERQVGSVSPNGLVRTEAYNGLTKAPQYYKGTYNFRDDTVGGNPTDWTVVETDGTVNIISNLDGHKKVVEISAVTGVTYMYHTFSSVQVDDTIELHIAVSDIGNKVFYVHLLEGASVRITLRFDNRDLYERSGGSYNLLKSDFMTASEFDVIKIVCNDTANTCDIYVNGVLVGDDKPYYSNSTTGIGQINCVNASNGTKLYIDAVGFSHDSGYTVGDNVVAWDVEINGNLDLIDINDKPSYYPKKLGITRATCVGAAGISQTYSDSDLEDGKAIVPLKEYRDLKLQAATETLQLATALFNVFSAETKFIGLRVVNQEYIRPGNTVNFANTGDVTISEDDLLVLYYDYDWVNDVYELMILTDNIVLLREMESYFDRSRIMVHQNSTAVNQNQVAINTKPTFYTDAGDPTVNDDTDLGYVVGDLWLNTTDKGLFVCCANGDGAADWDEITKA